MDVVLSHNEWIWFNMGSVWNNKRYVKSVRDSSDYLKKYL